MNGRLGGHFVAWRRGEIEPTGPGRPRRDGPVRLRGRRYRALGQQAIDGLGDAAALYTDVVQEPVRQAL